MGDTHTLTYVQNVSEENFQGVPDFMKALFPKKKKNAKLLNLARKGINMIQNEKLLLEIQTDV